MITIVVSMHWHLPLAFYMEKTWALQYMMDSNYNPTWKMVSLLALWLHFLLLQLSAVTGWPPEKNNALLKFIAIVVKQNMD